MNTLQINLPGREYKIDIGLNILDEQLLEPVLLSGTDHVVVVTNTVLQDLSELYFQGFTRVWRKSNNLRSA